MKYADYLGQTVNARYTIERNIDGADVPVQREGEVTITIDEEFNLVLDIDGDMLYPFDSEFELL